MLDTRKRTKYKGKLLVLRGKAWFRGKRVFRTALASQYPPDLCNKVVNLVGKLGKDRL